MEFPKQKKLYIYNKKHQRQHPDNVSFYFFGSGSTGNSVYLKKSRLLIDLGFPYKKYQNLSPLFFYHVRYVLLTHEHTDHLNVSTLFKLLDMYPHLQFLISKRMFNRITNPMYATNFNNDRKKRDAQKELLKQKYYQRFTIIDSDTKEITLYQHDLKLSPVQIYPHIVTHGDITNVAYEIKTTELHVLYSSDLDHVFAPERTGRIDSGLNLPLEYDRSGNVKIFEHPFDLIFLEANYDKDILERVLEEEPDNAHARGNLRHISEQETWHYIDYALANDGTFVPLHASQAYGTLVQDLD